MISWNSDSPLEAIGIDGCPAGWFYVVLGRSGPPAFGILPCIRVLQDLMGPRTLVLLDMPMGLKNNGPDERECDRRARRLLGRRGASIFPAPARPALDETDYAGASAVNHACTGRKLSKQSFYIMKKIREVDTFIRDFPGRNRIFESHPELAFLALNRFVPLAFSKKLSQGRQERLDVLTRFFPGAGSLYERAASFWPRKDLAPDDILDALVLAVSATLPMGRVPETVPKDAYGLPMQIVYPELPA